MSVLRMATVVLMTLAAAMTAQQRGQQDSPFSPVPPAPPDEPRQLQFVEALPEFEAKDLAGRRWTLGELKGRVTVIYIWAPLCLPCLRDTPLLQRVFERKTGESSGGGGLQVLTISPHEVREFVKTRGYTFPVIMSFELDYQFLPAWATTAVYVVDRAGRRTGSLRDWPLGKVILAAERLAARGSTRAGDARP